jgi:competence protein ComEA
VPPVAWIGVGAAAAAALALAYQVFFAPAPATRLGPPPRPTPAPLVVQVAGEVLNPGVYQLAGAARIADALERAGGPTDDGDPNQLNLAARVSDGQRIVVPRKQAPARPAPALERPLVNPAPAAEATLAVVPARADAAQTALPAGEERVETAMPASADAAPTAGLGAASEGMAPTEVPKTPTPVPARATATPRPVRTPTPDVRATLAAGGRLNLNRATLAELDALPGVGQVTAQKILDHRKQALFSSVEELRDLKIVTNSTFQRIKDLLTVE